MFKPGDKILSLDLKLIGTVIARPRDSALHNLVPEDYYLVMYSPKDLEYEHTKNLVLHTKIAELIYGL